MKNQQFGSIFLVLLITVYATQATFVQNVYKKIEAGRTFNGSIKAQYTTHSDYECSVRCSSAVECHAYQYKGTRPGNCKIIDTNSTENGTTLNVTENAVTYKWVWADNHVTSWTRPPSWTEPVPVKYWSFDTLECLLLMEGIVETNFGALTPGKVNNAVSTNISRSQWIDLGIHTEACMTRPQTCGVAGGAVSFWMKLIECPHKAGIISSITSNTTGFKIYCGGYMTKYKVRLPDGLFHSDISGKPDVWTHIVLNYLGPDNGMGIKLYVNGQIRAEDGVKGVRSFSPGDGRLVIGKSNTDKDQFYAGVQLDELLMFNTSLTDEEILLLSAQV